MSDTVIVDRRDDGVAVVTLNRPSARNAVNVELAGALVEAMASVQDMRCIVITGADPAFCAGLDLRNLGTDQLADLPPFIHTVATSARARRSPPSTAPPSPAGSRSRWRATSSSPPTAPASPTPTSASASTRGRCWSTCRAASAWPRPARCR